jgi:hypothetical protein
VRQGRRDQGGEGRHGSAPAPAWRRRESNIGFTGADYDNFEKVAEKFDVFTYPFYNFAGGAYGFVFVVKSFARVEDPVLYFTITQHGSCDNICVIDWLGKRDYQNPPMTNAQRPENSRCAHFAFGQAGDVVSYVRVLVSQFVIGKAGAKIQTEGILAIENADAGKVVV